MANHFIETVGEFLNGKQFTHDGISGVIRYTPDRVYPHGTLRASITHEADARGRKSEAYRKVKRNLQDDWISDLTDSDELIYIAKKLGFDFSIFCS